ncbi:hypothetical protein BpHYR1_028177 [Brachionus plicatilis]|uniref:Uncharacterized protein n=1 Tax=Brachionus plicatilis TaxID=10195 RepID=A0A3M7QHN0_BRAPC|nr:hypothetical protein BpHYR1_028177 [Brachionus plicatilis]
MAKQHIHNTEKTLREINGLQSISGGQWFMKRNSVGRIPPLPPLAPLPPSSSSAAAFALLVPNGVLVSHFLNDSSSST